MGMFYLFSSCSDRGCTEPVQIEYRYITTPSNNPDPENFEVLQLERVGLFTIMLVNYPNCTNFEGKKILVYKTLALGDPLRHHSLDPHFCDSTKHPSPVARFVPTAEGWWYATQFCKSIPT